MESGHSLAGFIDLLSISAEGWPLLGQDLWLEVFKRSPIEALCRFRCVCKSWKSVISSPFFFDLHHSFASSTVPSNLKPYFLVDYIADWNNVAIKSYSLFRPQPSLDEHPKHQVHFPFRFSNDSYRKLKFVDVIHGVVCISHTTHYSFDSIILWNPAIHKYVTLPSPAFPPLDWSMDDFSFVPDFNYSARFLGHAIGFCSGSSKNDFKVVRIWIPFVVIQEDCAWYNKPPPPASYQVYSSQDGLWRAAPPNIDLMACRFDSGSSSTSCLVNGTIHWLVNRIIADSYSDDETQFAVLMFNFEREEFRIMDLPKEFYPVGENVNEPLRADVMEYAGMLSVLVSRGLETRHVELWVMEEHGVSSTWRKLCGFNMDGIDVYQPSFEELSPYGPKQWKWNEERSYYDDRFEQIYCRHVYNESMFLMDYTKAQSYGKGEIVQL